MGGADVPPRTIGQRPAHWEVLGFNAMPPRTSSPGIDFFVFFPHEGRIEAFGRTVIEAMASGAWRSCRRSSSRLFGAGGGLLRARRGRRLSRAFSPTAPPISRRPPAPRPIVRARFGFEQHVARVAGAMAAPAPAGP